MLLCWSKFSSLVLSCSHPPLLPRQCYCYLPALEHDGTQGLPGYDCCSFPSQFFLIASPVPEPLAITSGRGFCCFHPQVSLRVLFESWKPHQIPCGLSKKAHCLSLPRISYQKFGVVTYEGSQDVHSLEGLVWDWEVGLMFLSGVLAGIALQSQNKIHYPGPGAGRYTA